MVKRRFKTSGFLVATLLIMSATVALVAYGKGYSYDFKNHRLVLNGLVLLETLPGGGEVTVNGEATGKQTPYRATMEAGSYDFGVNKTGFRSWSKTLDVVASEVAFTQYVLLFPDTVESKATALDGRPYGLTASPNGKQLAYLTKGKTAGLWLFDPAKLTTRQIFVGRKAAGKKLAETFSSVVWSGDNDRLLLASVSSGKANYTILSPGKTPNPQNLTDLFNQDFNQLKFNPAGSNELYWISPQHNLHRLNLGDRTASAVLAGKVSAFTFGGGRVFYVQDTKLGKSLFSLERSGIKQELIQALAASPSYELLYLRHGDVDFLAAVPSVARTATIYRDIFGQHPVSKVVAHDVDHIKSSPDGRFVVFYNHDSIVSYDVQKAKHYDFEKSFKSISDLEWFDNFHIIVMAAKRPNIVEFDGNNATSFEANLTGAVFPTPDHRAIIGLGSGSASRIVRQILRP